MLAEVLFGFDPVGFGDHGGQVEQSVFRGLKFGNDFAFFQRVEYGPKSGGAGAKSSDVFLLQSGGELCRVNSEFLFIDGEILHRYGVIFCRFVENSTNFISRKTTGRENFWNVVFPHESQPFRENRGFEAHRHVV